MRAAFMPVPAVSSVKDVHANVRIAYVRLLSGTLRVRDRVGEHTVTGIEVFDRAATVRRSCAISGEIARVWGLDEVRIGDTIGERRGHGAEHHFAPPTLETVVVPDPEHRRALHTALTQLAEQDPLIGLRLDEDRQELHLSLYGEVQKDVIQAALADDFGLDVEFRDTRPICIERPVGTGTAIETMPRWPVGTAPVPRWCRPARRSGTGRFGCRLPLRDRAWLAALGVHECDRRDRAPSTARRPPRLGGHRLHRHPDALAVPRHGRVTHTRGSARRCRASAATSVS